MFHSPTSSQFHESANSTSYGKTVKKAGSRGMPHVKRFLRLTFIRGPKVLITSRISGKCAALMMMLCSPSLLFCSVLTIPAMLFKSPQQHAYFYFSTVLNQDPGRWAVLFLTGICAVLALAIPATMTPTRSSPDHF